MRKKRLIATVTFLAGLYFFLEYMVPPTIPWRTVSGRVVSVPSNEQVLVKIDGRVRVVNIKPNTLIFRRRPTGGSESVQPRMLKAGDQVRIGPTTYLSQWQTDVNDFFVVLASMAWGMGLLSLWMVHSSNVRKRRPEWYLSVVFFAALGFGMVAGYGYGRSTDTWAGSLHDVVFNYALMPMGSTVFSLLTFYMASAAYRAFKAKSGEAILMMVSAFVIMLGQIPIGLWLTKWLPTSMQLPVISQWILYIANSAAVKGMWFGMMLGAIAIGLRFWLSLERGAFFDREL